MNVTQTFQNRWFLSRRILTATACGRLVAGVTCVRRRLPCTGITQLRFTRLVWRVSAVLCDDPTPCWSSVLTLLFGLIELTHEVAIGLGEASQERQGLTGCHDNVVCSVKGPTTPGPQPPLADSAAVDIAFRVYGHLSGIQKETYISGPTPFRSGQPVQHFHPHYLSCLRIRLRLRERPLLYADNKTQYWACG